MYTALFIVSIEKQLSNQNDQVQRPVDPADVRAIFAHNFDAHRLNSTALKNDSIVSGSFVTWVIQFRHLIDFNITCVRVLVGGVTLLQTSLHSDRMQNWSASS